VGGGEVEVFVSGSTPFSCINKWRRKEPFALNGSEGFVIRVFLNACVRDYMYEEKSK
jgi:hypothetical protein